MKATRMRAPSGQRVFAGCVSVGGLPDAHRKRVEPLASERLCQLLPTEGCYRLGRRVDSCQASDLTAKQTSYIPTSADSLVSKDHLQRLAGSLVEERVSLGSVFEGDTVGDELLQL